MKYQPINNKTAFFINIKIICIYNAKFNFYSFIVNSDFSINVKYDTSGINQRRSYIFWVYECTNQYLFIIISKLEGIHVNENWTLYRQLRKQVRERWNLLQRYHERTKVQIEVFYRQLAQMMEWVCNITKTIITPVINCRNKTVPKEVSASEVLQPNWSELTHK